MSRPVVILCFCILVFLFFASAATEQVRDFSVEITVVNALATFLFVIGACCYCGFAAIHAVQHVADPQERAVWLIVTIYVNVLGSIFYLLTKYQCFRKIGKGSLIRGRRKWGSSEFWQLTEDEKAKNA